MASIDMASGADAAKRVAIGKPRCPDSVCSCRTRASLSGTEEGDRMCIELVKTGGRTMIGSVDLHGSARNRDGT